MDLVEGRSFCIMGSEKKMQGYKMYRKRCTNRSKSIMCGQSIDRVNYDLRFRVSS